MQDNNIREKCRELATRLYELDGEVYESVGSSLDVPSPVTEKALSGT